MAWGFCLRQHAMRRGEYRVRLDKYLADMGAGTRSQVKEAVRKGRVSVNGAAAKRPELQVTAADSILFDGKEISYTAMEYYMLYKPAGVLSATKDDRTKTVLDLIDTRKRKDLFPVGRLDKDTEGLLLITNDGELAHRLLSPRHHIPKVYEVRVDGRITEDMCRQLREGIRIEENFTALPAEINVLQTGKDESEAELTICEGKFHQVKRMFAALGLTVTYLKRLSMGSLTLDESLGKGGYRPLTEEELKKLQRTVLPDSNREEHMLKHTKAVIFDLDGTLVDSMWMWRKIDEEYLDRFSVPLPENLQREIEGMSFSETAHYFKEHFPIPDSIDDIKRNWNEMAWEKYEKQVPLKPGARTFLKQLREQGISLGIATSNSRELVEMVTRVHGIRDYFSAVITGCDVGKGKPNPEIYLKAAEEMAVKPADCLVFEDIVQGILAGKNAGMRVCAVEDEYSMFQKEQKQELADYYICTYEELLKSSVEIPSGERMENSYEK